MKNRRTVSRIGFPLVVAGAIALAGVTMGQAQTGPPSGNVNATNEDGHQVASPPSRLDSSGRWWNSRTSIVNVGTSTALEPGDTPPPRRTPAGAERGEGQ